MQRKVVKSPRPFKNEEMLVLRIGLFADFECPSIWKKMGKYFKKTTKSKKWTFYQK